MTEDRVQAFLEGEDNQSIFTLSLTLQQLRKHWQLLLIGSSMAEYLDLLDIPSDSVKAITIDPTHIVLTCMQYSSKSYEKRLAQHWFELGDELAEVYSKVRSTSS